MDPRLSTREQIETLQSARLQALFQALEQNPFYQRKFASSGCAAPPSSVADFCTRFPFTTKAELVVDQSQYPPYGSNRTEPLGRYIRFHQTSGTTSAPLRWLDTQPSWDAMVDGWIEVFQAAGITREDRVLFTFSFGPFIGFWLAFEAAVKMGALTLPAGGLSSTARLRVLGDNQATVLCCTPTYALRLAEVAAAEQLPIDSVRILLVAGEPGGSQPATRRELEHRWPGARLVDHHGMTEVGPVTYQCPVEPGLLHVMEERFIAEVIDPITGGPATPGETGELVLTPLTRLGTPLIRYRTGDLVRPRLRSTPCACGRHTLALEGGILGRADDMVVIRGVNVFPGIVDELIREQPGVTEYRMTVERQGTLTGLRLELEAVPALADPSTLAARIEQRLHELLTLRVAVTLVPPGALPRFEMKARRWVKPSP